MLERTVKLSKQQSFFLFGARGTGKTSLLDRRFTGPNTLYIDLLNTSDYTELSIDPLALEERVKGKKALETVIIDEVQKIPALLDIVHRLIEKNDQLQFILTGSSARKLKRGGANLLAGRAFVYHLHPLTAEELGEHFDLNEVLMWGTLPRMLKLEDKQDKEEFLRSYASTYLKEEILQEQLIRKLEPFQRFLPIAAQTSGNIVNFSNIARDVGCAPQTVENYFHILEDTLIGFFLPAYHPSVRKQERSSPKFYLFDIGVIKALSREIEIPIKAGTYAYGKYFEHWLIQEIHRLNSYKHKDDQMYYYQTQGGLEIDLILDRPGRPTALIEIKSTTQVKESHLTHLNSIAKDFAPCETYCLSLDSNARQIGKVSCRHWTEGLQELGLT